MGGLVNARVPAEVSADLLDCDRGFPRLLFVENGQADGARRVYVGVEEWWREFACRKMSKELHMA